MTQLLYQVTNFPFLYCPENENMAVTGCLYHSSRSFKGYVYLFVYKQFIITIELNRIETLNWVNGRFQEWGLVTLYRAHNKNRHDRGKKNIFLGSPYTKHKTNIFLLVYHEYRLL